MHRAQERNMVRRLAALLAAAAFFSAFVATANADDAKAAKAAPKPDVFVASPIQDCSDFFESYDSRGFGWGSSPAGGVGSGLFEGAMTTYSANSFPDWRGDCSNWGHYSATGSSR
jgi:hypothetical protein